jgi:hypothetical protein
MRTEGRTSGKVGYHGRGLVISGRYYGKQAGELIESVFALLRTGLELDGWLEISPHEMQA